MGLATTRAGGRFFTTVMPALDKAVLKCTGNRHSISGLGAPILLLTTIGRHSGQPRSAPLLYLCEADTVVVLGSKGGRPGHPAWYLNLMRHRDVEITIAGVTQPDRAELVENEDYARLWQRFIAFNPGFAKYQQRLQRQIPIVVLRPAGASPTPDLFAGERSAGETSAGET